MADRARKIEDAARAVLAAYDALVGGKPTPPSYGSIDALRAALAEAPAPADAWECVRFWTVVDKCGLMPSMPARDIATAHNDRRELDRAFPNSAPHRVVPLYTKEPR